MLWKAPLPTYLPTTNRELWLKELQDVHTFWERVFGGRPKSTEETKQVTGMWSLAPAAAEAANPYTDWGKSSHWRPPYPSACYLMQPVQLSTKKVQDRSRREEKLQSHNTDPRSSQKKKPETKRKSWEEPDAKIETPYVQRKKERDYSSLLTTNSANQNCSCEMLKVLKEGGKKHQLRILYPAKSSLKSDGGGCLVALWLSSPTQLWWPRVHGFGSCMHTCALLIKPHCGSVPHRK